MSPRLLVPDFARGIALLGIALANLPTAWIFPAGTEVSYFGEVRTPLDQALVILSAMFVHNRGLPMFSTLLGFGIGLIAMSLWRKGFPVSQARRVLVRRYGWLAIFGLIHGLALFYGDIMLTYGLCGMIIATLLTFKDKTLLLISYIVLGAVAVIGIALAVLAGTFGDAAPAAFGGQPATYLELLQYNALFLGMSLLSFPTVLFAYLPVMVIGFVWARRGVLAHPEQHLTMLRIWAGIAVAVFCFVGIPWGLAPESGAWILANTTLGVLTGPGILALITLALRNVNTSAAWTRPFVALGKRSMSGYVAQSVLFFTICYPFTLAFVPQTITGQTLLACGVWAATLLMAWGLEALGKKGPLEVLHRKAAYSRRTLAAMASAVPR